MSRNAWHEALVQWGVQIIISGHTHLPAWLPPTEEFPYGQLIAGGSDEDVNSPEAATWIEGIASGNELVLSMRTLDGAQVHRVVLDPLHR